MLQCTRSVCAHAMQGLATLRGSDSLDEPIKIKKAPQMQCFSDFGDPFQTYIEPKATE